MSIEDAQALVAEAMNPQSPEACRKAAEATRKMGLYFETLGWTTEQYRAEIHRLREELASAEEDLRDLRDFDV